MAMTGEPAATPTRAADGRWEDDDVAFYEDAEARRAVSTTEFWVYLIATIALLFFTYDSGDDSLSRDDGWRYATALTIGYLLSRGLAKAGSSEPRIRRRNLD
jgi:hypothetical protein